MEKPGAAQPRCQAPVLVQGWRWAVLGIRYVHAALPLQQWRTGPWAGYASDWSYETGKEGARARGAEAITKDKGLARVPLRITGERRTFWTWDKRGNIEWG